MWNEGKMKALGTCKLSLENPKISPKYMVKFIVVEEDLTPCWVTRQLRRRKLSKLITISLKSVGGVVEYKHDTLQDFPDMSSGDIGTLPGSVQLTLKADKKQFVAHQKYYPLNYEERDRLVDTAVLARVDEPITG